MSVVTNGFEPLSAVEREEYLTALRRGASAMGACETVGICREQVLATELVDADFSAAVAEVSGVLSQNAASKLYREAMQGNVPALTFLLKQQPPPEWSANERTSRNSDAVSALSDEELLRELRRTQGVVEELDR